MSYDVGDGVPIVYTIKAAATVVCTVTDPDGIDSTPATTQGVGPPTVAGGPPTVTYTAQVAASKPGTWKYRFVASGALTDAEEGLFTVRRPLGQGDVYCTVGELREQVGDSRGQMSEVLLRRATLATSRAVVDLCGRRFTTTLTPTDRLYRPRSHDSLITHDIATKTGLVVRSDEAGDGSYTTVWTIDTDYLLEPSDAEAEGEPWWRIVAVGPRRFPVRYVRRPSVKVTARFGWLTLPDDVNQAAILKGAKVFKRWESPDGFASGMGEFGPVRISRFEDPDAWALLHNLIRFSTPDT
jgi:hypothetical protein